MDILLILASYKKNVNFTRFIYPALELQQISSLTNDNYNINMVDERFNQINFKKKYQCDLVGISTTTYNAFRAYELADEFRKRGITVVLGGWHPSALPEEAKQHADSVVIGEAEDTWPQLLKDFEKGELKPFYYQEKPVNLDFIPPADHDLYKGTHLFDAVQASRGCPHGCEFCSISNMKYRNEFRKRKIKNIRNEVESLKRKHIIFNDPSLTIDVKFTKNLFLELKKLDKKIFCNGNINVLGKDEELLKLASEAGCIGWFVGLESISQESLDTICKKPNVVADYKKAIKKIRDYNMAVNGSFIFGFDKDTPDIFDKTIEVIDNLDLDVAICDILTPYPGTPLYSRLEKQNRIITKDWSKYDTLNVVFKPKKMTEEQLFEGTHKVIRHIYSYTKTLKRTLKSSKLGYPFLTTTLQNIPILSAGLFR